MVLLPITDYYLASRITWVVGCNCRASVSHIRIKSACANIIQVKLESPRELAVFVVWVSIYTLLRSDRLRVNDLHRIHIPIRLLSTVNAVTD